MSAILGILNRSGKPVDEQTLYPAMAAIDCYTHDRTATWANDTAAFGHIMRFTTPESLTETLPLTVGDLTITADARLDYRDDLFAALAIPHSERSNLPDSLLILRAYEKWGENCPKFLIGDYAFVIWDARQQLLFGARDHIGVKPLYYYDTPELFAFATDLRALLAFNDVAVEIDETEIANYLLLGILGYEGKYHTFFKNVHKLTYGHSFTLHDGDLRTQRYWFPADTPKIRLASVEQYADRLYELVEQAVAARLRTAFPVGTHLSGGMDSSAVTVLAARLLRQRGQKPDVFSWSPPPGEHWEKTEHRRILPVCEQEGIEPIFTEQTLEAWEAMQGIDVSTTPVNTLSMESIIQPKAAERGIRVMLSGWGGDEFVSYYGDGLAAEWFLRGRWLKLAQLLGLRGVFRNPLRLRRVSRRFWEKVALPLLPDSVYLALSGKTRSAWRTTFIAPEFAARLKSQLRPPAAPVRVLRSAQATQCRIYENGYLSDRIESWAIFGAEYGLTYGFPLLDRRVMEFIFAIPGELHTLEGKWRYLHRRAMARILPASVAWDLVKDDPALIAHGLEFEARLAEADSKDSLIDRSRTNLWVDVARLREVIERKDQAKVSIQQASAYRAAVDSLIIWNQWYNHKKLS